VTDPSGGAGPTPATEAATPAEAAGQDFQDTRPPVAVSGIIYGEFVYWITILGSIIAIIGATIAMFGVPNYLDTSYVFSAIWEGKTTVEIWEGATGEIPNGHWYLPRLSNGDALAMFGLALGVFSVIPGMIGAAIAMFKKKETLYGTFATIAVILCITSLLGLIRMPSKSGPEAEESGEVAVEVTQSAEAAIS
jgi:hypothetical protein